MTFIRGQVSQAVNEGADLVIEGLELDERDTDLVNLVVNAVMARLDAGNGALDLDDVIRESYDEDPAEVRGWLA